MRIGTWNTDFALPRDLESLRSQIEAHPADIWILTETNDDLRAKDHPFLVSATQRESSETPGWVRERSHWVSITSRFEMTAVPDFAPHDPERTVAAMVDIRGLGDWHTAIVYGTVLPEGSNEEFETAVTEQAREWEWLKSRYPNALFCIAGDFNTDMGAAQQFNIQSFFRSRFGPDVLRPVVSSLGLSCATDHDFPDVHSLRYPPIDHIVLPKSLEHATQISSIWAGRNGDGYRVEDRIGVVVEVAAA
jgi:hypothetical protein